MNQGNQTFISTVERPRRIGWRERIFRRGFRPTAVGLGVLTLTAAITAAAFNTGTNLLYLMVSMLLALIAISAVYSRLNLVGMEVHRRMPGEVFAGEDCDIEIELTNGKRWFGSYGIAVREELPEMEPRPLAVFFVSVPAKRTARRDATIRFTRRGLMELGRIDLLSTFPFGFIEYRVTKFPRTEVLVFPRLLPVESFMAKRSPEPGVQEAGAKGHGVSLFSIRDYAPGDSARTIHWKLSAKTGGLKVREYEREELKRVELVLDFVCPNVPTLEDHAEFEHAVSVTASIARYLLEAGYEIGLWSAAGSVPSGSGPQQLRRVMRSLALAEIESFLPAGFRHFDPREALVVCIGTAHGGEAAGHPVRELAGAPPGSMVIDAREISESQG